VCHLSHRWTADNGQRTGLLGWPTDRTENPCRNEESG
jgi:hypothetical protein